MAAGRSCAVPRALLTRRASARRRRGRRCGRSAARCRPAPRPPRNHLTTLAIRVGLRPAGQLGHGDACDQEAPAALEALSVGSMDAEALVKEAHPVVMQSVTQADRCAAPGPRPCPAPARWGWAPCWCAGWVCSMLLALDQLSSGCVLHGALFAQVRRRSGQHGWRRRCVLCRAGGQAPQGIADRCPKRAGTSPEVLPGPFTAGFEMSLLLK